MNKRLGLAALALGVGTLASGSAFAQSFTITAPAPPRVVVRTAPVQPAYVQPGYVQPGYVQPGYVQPGYVQPGIAMRRGRNPVQFGQQLRVRMNDIEREVRQDVNRGRAHPNALSALAQERNRVELQLARASADGVIAPFERRDLNRRVDAMERIDDQFRTRRFGGGPRFIIGR